MNEKERLKEVIEKALDNGFAKHTPLTCGFLAEELYNEGYRKQIEGEWVTKHLHRGGFRTVTVVDSLGEKHTGIVDDRWECDDLYCSVCGKIAHDAFLNYCANCGAKMSEDERSMT